ncbi:MAG: nicotinamide-nucleotide amidohydrolase family protein [Pseudomonadota bacterium]|nr:nicotinamide-nucleotide amidohydrolase family protein [Pseudomonadota bacterium]
MLDRDLGRLATRVGIRLLATQCSVATAESCTGGFIAKALTDIAGSSQWFLEGFVTYSNESKVRRLGIPRSILQREGAVSEPIARAMAIGAIKRARAQVAVAVTGIAGPAGAVPGKPVGTVWLAWAQRRGSTIRVRALRKKFRGDRDTVRRKTVQVALQGLLTRVPMRAPRQVYTVVDTRSVLYEMRNI